MQAVVFDGDVKIRGCLGKAVIKRGCWTWKRHWVWLHHDCLCDAPVCSQGGSINYIPLDRITVRPLPRGYKPRIGVQHIDDSITALSKAGVGNAMARQAQGKVFSVQYGSKTMYWVADSPQEAKAWMQAIRDAWVAALLNADRYMRRSVALLDTDERHSACSKCASDRKHTANAVAIGIDQKGDQECLYDVEIHTKEAKAWVADARPWIELHCAVPGESSGRHLLAPVDRMAEAFSPAAVATCQIRIFTGRFQDIKSVELGLHGDCILWAPEKVCIRPHGSMSWTEFPCDSVLSTAH